VEEGKKIHGGKVVCVKVVRKSGGLLMQFGVKRRQEIGNYFFSVLGKTTDAFLY
jgi:hypothetical protein